MKRREVCVCVCVGQGGAGCLEQWVPWENGAKYVCGGVRFRHTHFLFGSLEAGPSPEPHAGPLAPAPPWFPDLRQIVVNLSYRNAELETRDQILQLFRFPLKAWSSVTH